MLRSWKCLLVTRDRAVLHTAQLPQLSFSWTILHKYMTLQLRYHSSIFTCVELLLQLALCMLSLVHFSDLGMGQLACLRQGMHDADGVKFSMISAQFKSGACLPGTLALARLPFLWWSSGKSVLVPATLSFKCLQLAHKVLWCLPCLQTI